MKRSSFMLLVVTTSMALVAGCSRTANTPPPVANLDEGPLTEQDEDAIRDQIISVLELSNGGSSIPRTIGSPLRSRSLQTAR